MPIYHHSDTISSWKTRYSATFVGFILEFLNMHQLITAERESLKLSGKFCNRLFYENNRLHCEITVCFVR